LSLLQKPCFAVVGTRKITSYGKEAIQNIIPEISHHFVIVSGLAIGVDAYAHEKTLESGGKAVAVLGGPVTRPSPSSNISLARKILENDGLLISEYGDKDGVFASNFAIRDRIVSGLSKGVLVIEAAEKSGSLITAKSAVDQNRDVFAVPGNIFSQTSAGTNWLIKNGAKLVSTSTDILEEYDKLPLAKNSIMSTSDPLEIHILGILDANGPSMIDLIIEQSGKNASEIISTISIMEIKGLIKQMDGGIYRKI
jgi:DNA processing protein